MLELSTGGKRMVCVVSRHETCRGGKLIYLSVQTKAKRDTNSQGCKKWAKSRVGKKEEN